MNNYVARFELTKDSYVVLQIPSTKQIKTIVDKLVEIYELQDIFSKLTLSKNDVLRLGLTLGELDFERIKKFSISIDKADFTFNVSLLYVVDSTNKGIQQLNLVGGLNYEIEFEYFPSKYSALKLKEAFEQSSLDFSTISFLDKCFTCAARFYGHISLEEFYKVITNYIEITFEDYLLFAAIASHKHKVYYIVSDNKLDGKHVEKFEKWSIVIEDLLCDKDLFYTVKESQKNKVIAILEKNNFLNFYDKRFLPLNAEFEKLCLFLISTDQDIQLKELLEINNSVNLIVKLRKIYSFDDRQELIYNQLLNSYLISIPLWKNNGHSLRDYDETLDDMFTQKEIVKLKRFITYNVKNNNLKEELLDIFIEYEQNIKRYIM